MPVNPDIIFILLYFQKKVYRQSDSRPPGGRGIFPLLTGGPKKTANYTIPLRFMVKQPQKGRFTPFI